MMPQPAIYASNAERQAAYRKRRAAAVKAQAAIAPLPALPALPTIPGDARWRIAMQHSYCLAEQTIEQMNEYFNDRREAWQEGERGEDFQERTEALEAIYDDFTDWIQKYYPRR